MNYKYWGLWTNRNVYYQCGFLNTSKVLIIGFFFFNHLKVIILKSSVFIQNILLAHLPGNVHCITFHSYNFQVTNTPYIFFLSYLVLQSLFFLITKFQSGCISPYFHSLSRMVVWIILLNWQIDEFCLFYIASSPLFTISLLLVFTLVSIKSAVYSLWCTQRQQNGIWKFLKKDTD